MTQITWNDFGEKYFELGVDRGVLYPKGSDGVAWNGLIEVNESPSGGDTTPYYIDGVKYANRSAPEEFEASIEAYTYPDEFALCDGTKSVPNAQGLFATQQARQSFGLCYRTRIGNDSASADLGYKIHLVYNALAEPTEKNYKTQTGEDEPLTFNWKISTTNVITTIPGINNSSHLIIDTRLAWPWAVTAIENVLYGTEDTPPRLPTPEEIMALFIENAYVQVTDNGDGTATISGPDSAVSMVNLTEYMISWPSVVYVDSTSFEISPL